MPLLPQLRDFDPDAYQSLDRVLAWGIPAACMVLGAVIAESRGVAVRSHLIPTLGPASYSIYLLHPIVLGQLLKVPPTMPPASWALCIAATIARVALSVAFFRWIEAPLLSAIRRKLGDEAPLTTRIATAAYAESAS